MINYQNIKLLNKNGIEIPLLFTSNIIITDANSLSEISDDNLVIYGVTNKNNNIIELTNLYLKSSGKFNEPRIDGTFNLIIDNNVFKDAVTLMCNDESCFSRINVLTNTGEQQLYKYAINDINNVTTSFKYDISDNLLYPSLIFYGKLDFGKVSAGLFETQTIFPGIIKENVFNVYKNDNYYLTYTISDNSHFKFFSYNTTTDEIILEKTSSNIANICFSADQEGVYENKMFINLTNEHESITIGQIDLTCECIGEDERYRALFTNFGIQHPSSYYNIFKESDIIEKNIDWELINTKSKELFLTYDKIFPYVGTYKALINSIKYLGYDDIYFKEWYKIIKDDSDSEMCIEIDLSNISPKHLDNKFITTHKKLNKLSMHYKISTESGKYDNYDIPEIINVYNYSLDEVIIKLFALKRWLERNILGVNCKIIDITGEGITYEKINYFTYGTNMQNIIYEDTIEINPSIKNTIEHLYDSSANISITSFSNNIDNFTKLEDFKTYKFNSNELSKSTLKFPFIKDFTAKAINKSENVILGDEYIESDSRKIWLNNGELYLMHNDEKISGQVLVDEDNELLLNNDNVFSDETLRTSLSAIFKNPPIIQLSSATLLNSDTMDIYGSVYSVIVNNAQIFYEITYNNITKTSIDYIYLYPSNDASFEYTQYNSLNVPMFLFKNYDIVIYNDNHPTRIALNGSFYININVGKILLNKLSLSKKDRISILSFYYNNDSNEQKIELINEYTKSFEYVPETTHLYDINNVPIYSYDYDRFHNLNVNHTGEYDIYVYAKNTNGNIVKKHISEKCKIYQSAPLIKIYTYNENISSDDIEIVSKNADNYDDIINIIKNDTEDKLYNNNKPFFREKYLVNDLIYKNHEYIQYNNISYSIDTANYGDTINIFNISGIFKFNKIDEIDDTVIYLICNNNKNILSKDDKVKVIIFDKIYNTAINELSGKIIDITNNEFKIKMDYKSYAEIIKSSLNNYEYILSVINISEYSITPDTFYYGNNEIQFKINNANNIKFNKGDIIKLIYTIDKYADTFYLYKNGSEFIDTYNDETKYENFLKTLHYNHYTDQYIKFNNDNTIDTYKKLYDTSVVKSFSDMTTLRINDVNENGTYSINSNFKFNEFVSYANVIDVNNDQIKIKVSDEFINVVIKSDNMINGQYVLENSKITIKVAPAHQAFVKYTMPAINSKEFDAGYNRIYTSVNKLYNYIDNTFSCNVSKFDNNNAFYMWSDDISLYDTSIYIHNAPITIPKFEKNDIIIDVTPVDNNDVSTYWDVYEVNTLNGTRKLLFEVLNDKMYLTSFDNDLYDIVAHSYDKYGNMISVEHNGIIKTI